MPQKRKADASVKGATKTGRTSKDSSPGPRGPRCLDGSSASDLDGGVDQTPSTLQSMVKFDGNPEQYRFSLKPEVHDIASRHFSAGHDFTALQPKHDHHKRPLWVQGNHCVILESYHPMAQRAQDFLVDIAEPVSRPQFLHEYHLTPHSLYAAASLGLNPGDIISTLEALSKTFLPANVKDFVSACGKSYGKVKLVLRNNKYFIETTDAEVFQKLSEDGIISGCRVYGAQMMKNAPEVIDIAFAASNEAAGVMEAEGLNNEDNNPVGAIESPTTRDVYDALNDGDANDDQDIIVHALQIRDDAISEVMKRCLELKFPALEEYDFRNDGSNASLDIDLQPATQIRSYQEKSLSKMFGNGRAKSGIIVLPCGAGKTLVGIAAACTIKKSVIVLATSNMSVVQWRNEILKWSSIHPDDVAIFTSDHKENVRVGNTGVVITTYSMVAATQRRSYKSQKMMDFLEDHEWGLMLLDEVHVVPAQMFRKVIGRIKAHTKLGLTATLLREDDKIEDLNILIGPKLYEANWMELSQQGHIARVQCAEVWCTMPPDFHNEYLKSPSKSLLAIMNPMKIQACQYLITYHESRGDKIIVFSDDVYALEFYARKLMKPYLHGGTSNTERQAILQHFRNSDDACNTIFLSKIGDTSLDLPEATCLIQISSHYGSRRQEAQRLGRVLRAKRRNDEGFNAFFYSLVSKDTQEMLFSSKRQAFLVDQGYAFRLITTLHDLENTPNLCFASAQERHELLLGLLDDMRNKSAANSKSANAALIIEGNPSKEGQNLKSQAKSKARCGAHLLENLSPGEAAAQCSDE